MMLYLKHTNFILFFISVRIDVIHQLLHFAILIRIKMNDRKEILIKLFLNKPNFKNFKLCYIYIHICMCVCELKSFSKCDFSLIKEKKS